MQAIVIHGARDLRLEACPAASPGSGEAQIDLALGGICGSDLHYYNHGGFGAIRLREPMILGHEVAGHVRALGPDGSGPDVPGPDVSGLAVGDLVAVSPSLPCATCQFCQAGLPNHCLNMRFFGSAMPFPHIQGAFRKTLTTEARRCVPATGLSPALAAMAEPLSVVLHATRLASDRAGELAGKTVLVTGCGPIGLLAILAARWAGAHTIIATDLSDFTLQTARRIGADHIFNSAETPDALDPFHKDKGQIDVLFECSGAAAALAGAIPALRPRGVILQLGLGGDMAVPMMAITAKELTLQGAFRFHEEFATAIALMQQGAIDPSPLITHTHGFDDAEIAFQNANNRQSALKAQIDFRT